MDETQSNSDHGAAEELFAERFDDLEAGTPGVLEDLCGAHPEYAEIFRQLFQSWERAQGLLGAGAPVQPKVRATLSPTSVQKRAFVRAEIHAELARGRGTLGAPRPRGAA